MIKFKYYVLNYDFNSKKVIMYNIFNNWKLNEDVFKRVKKYIRSPKKYKYREFTFVEKEDIEIYGFEAFKRDVLGSIRRQEWSRVEYEIGVTEPFPNEKSKIEKWDCYAQCEPNIEAICHEVIRQYKESKKVNCNEQYRTE